MSCLLPRIYSNIKRSHYLENCSDKGKVSKPALTQKERANFNGVTVKDQRKLDKILKLNRVDLLQEVDDNILTINKAYQAAIEDGECIVVSDAPEEAVKQITEAYGKEYVMELIKTMAKKTPDKEYLNELLGNLRARLGVRVVTEP